MNIRERFERAEQQQDGRAAALVLPILLGRIEQLDPQDRDQFPYLLRGWDMARFDAKQEFVSLMTALLEKTPVSASPTPAAPIPKPETTRDRAVRIGAKIRCIRSHIGLSQSDLARRLRCPRLWIGNIEDGWLTADDAVIKQIAEALGVRPSDLDPHCPPNTPS